MKSVREIAEIVEVSKVSVYKALKRDNIKEHVIKQGNMTYVDETGERLLIELFKLNVKFNKVKSSDNDEILFLREQINTLNSEKSELLKQIDKLTTHAENLSRLNENSQILLAQQKIESLPPPASEKVSLWSKIFRRKN